MTQAVIRVGVRNCARCKGNHDLLEFVPLECPSDEWTHFAMCPSNNQPIMLRTMAGNQLDNTVVHTIIDKKPPQSAIDRIKEIVRWEGNGTIEAYLTRLMDEVGPLIFKAGYGDKAFFDLLNRPE